MEKEFDFYKKIDEILAVDYETNNIERKFLFVYMGYLQIEVIQDIIDNKIPTLVVCYIYAKNDKYPLTDDILELIKDHRIMLIEKDPADELNKKMDIVLHALKYRDSQFIMDANCRSFNEDYMKDFKKNTESSIRNFNAMHSFDLMRIKNAIIHIPKILKSNLKVDVKDRSIPSVVCAAGPSLMTQLEYLKEVQDKVYIISVGHAMFALINAGIKIDFVVEVDPIGGHCSEAAAWLTRGEKNPPKKYDIPLVTDISNSTSTTSRFDKIIWRSLYPSSFVNNVINGRIKLKRLLTNSTVTCTALDFATELSDNITLIGSDLAIEKDGTCHAGEKIDDARNILDYPKKKGLDNKYVYSSSGFFALGNALETVIGLIRDREKDNKKNKTKLGLYNSTTRGLFIEGLDRMQLEDFIDKFANIAKEDNVVSANLAKKDIKEIEECLKHNVEALEGYLKNMDRILKLFAMAEKGKFPVGSPYLLEFKECLKKENKFKDDKSINYLTLCVERYIEECQLDTEHKLLLEDFGRYKILTNFMTDIYNSMVISKNKEEYDENIGMEFYAFRKYAIDFIEQSNPELAEYLIKENPQPNELVYYLSFFQNKPPGITMEVDNKIVSLAQYNQHNEICDKFVKENNFNEEKDVVVFFAPGNWSYILDFTFKYPKTNIIIIEPDLAIFNNFCKLGMFIHRFTEKTVVVGMDDNLKKWKRIYHSAIREQKRAGKRILFYEQPFTWKFKYIQEKLEILKSL